MISLNYTIQLQIVVCMQYLDSSGVYMLRTWVLQNVCFQREYDELKAIRMGQDASQNDIDVKIYLKFARWVEMIS